MKQDMAAEPTAVKQTRKQNQPEIPDIRMAELGLTKLISNFAQSAVIRSS